MRTKKKKGVVNGTYTKKINTRELIQLLKMDDMDLKSYLADRLRAFGYKPIVADGFIYAEGDIPVGLVAHMDTVFTVKPRYVFYTNGIMRARKGLGADDRAGIYGILHLLELGLRPTVIFTEDEEIGCVGAEKFAQWFKYTGMSHNLKHLIELDRQGKDDAVFYEGDNQDFISFVEGYGFKERFGSFTDICKIAPAMDISAVNLSVGYYLQHTSHEYLVIGELARTLKMVAKMLTSVPKDAFGWVENDWKSKYASYYYSSGTGTSRRFTTKWDDDDWEYSNAYSKTNYSMDDDDDYDESIKRLLTNCVLIKGDGEVIDVDDSYEVYYIDIFDNIWNEYDEKIEAWAYNHDFMPIGYYHFA